MKATKIISAHCEEAYDNLCTVAEYYGLELQICKTLEELGELSASLARRQLDQNYGGVLEEIADVYNMLDQLCILLDCEDKVADIAETKMQRQLKRMEGENGLGTQSD